MVQAGLGKVYDVYMRIVLARFDDMALRVLSHDDPGMEPLREKLKRHVRQAEMLGLPYWAFAIGSDPVGVVSVGTEPVMLYASVGTKLSLIRVVDYGKPLEVLEEFAAGAMAITRENDTEYSYISFPVAQEGVEDVFKKEGFQELADTYRMACDLGSYDPSGVLRLERVERGELDGFIELAIECMGGSPDVVLTMVLKNLRGMPENLLDLWFSLEKFFVVYDGEEPVGILDLNVKEGVVSNVGVATAHRGKGYGREIMLHGLKTLAEEGVEKASLRVHVDNKVAIGLYESLGFSAEDRIKHLIWCK
jgi:ribosomal protein S18 acetylase RimI-like enzyme